RAAPRRRRHRRHGGLLGAARTPGPVRSHHRPPRRGAGRGRAGRRHDRRKPVHPHVREAAGMKDTASPAPAPARRAPAGSFGSWRARAATYGTFIGFVLVVILFAALRPDAFLSPFNLRNILEQVAILAVITATMTIVMVAGDFDLSVGALASLAGVAVASLLLAGWGTVPAVLAGLALGAAAGALNGFLVAYAGLSAFVTTLATMTAFRGLALWYTDGATLFGLPDGFLVLGQGNLGPVPVPVAIMAGMMAAAWLVLTQTTAGRRWYAVGGNPEAAFLAGVNV